tara:strand:+ start:48 stop:419 length:372 start_codon:yes stop_codon:yes gene_type:complete
MASLSLSVVIGESTPTLSLTVTSSVEIPKEVFIFEQLVEKDASGNFINSFYSVANVAQLTDIPSEVSLGNPFFRQDTAEFTFSNYVELNTHLTNIQDSINLTVKSWNDSSQFTDKTFSVSFPY